MLDLRRIRIGIEVNGRINYYEGLRVKASGTKYATPLQNDCTLTITGLKQETRDYLLTETSAFNANRTPKRLIVEVGRQSTGLFRLFLGDIESAEPSSPPDIDLTIKAKTQLAAAGKLVANSGGASSSLSSLAQAVAKDLDLTLDFQAKERNVANYNHTGAALKQVEKLQAAGGVSAYIDDDTLVVKDVAAPLNGRLRVLNMHSGMVGIPKPTEKGVKVTFLIDPETVIGGALRIDSKLNPAINGDYVINQLAFDAQSHDDPFFYTALATRL
jgi:hypothetical protein